MSAEFLSSRSSLRKALSYNALEDTPSKARLQTGSGSKQNPKNLHKKGAAFLTAPFLPAISSVSAVLHIKGPFVGIHSLIRFDHKPFRSKARVIAYQRIAG